ncbi:hypothetical protein FPV67DRAFT_796216 [Lyophyllum atratum]|nr:hypothetical protein FPV67DRAFT_796216 [Lyophyllum atratum]
MTLDKVTHASFDNLNLWFEATVSGSLFLHPEVLDMSSGNRQPIPNLRCPTRVRGPCRCGLVTFTRSDPVYPLPDPKYLAVHAAACKVASRSGAQHYNKIIGLQGLDAA